MDIADTASHVSRKEPFNWGLIAGLLACIAFWAIAVGSILAIA